MDCMAAIPCAAGSRSSAFMMKAEKAKNTNVKMKIQLLLIAGKTNSEEFADNYASFRSDFFLASSAANQEMISGIIRSKPPGK